jgi:hypothetical protein
VEKGVFTVIPGGSFGHNFAKSVFTGCFLGNYHRIAHLGSARRLLTAALDFGIIHHLKKKFTVQGSRFKAVAHEPWALKNHEKIGGAGVPARHATFSTA